MEYHKPDVHTKNSNQIPKCWFRWQTLKCHRVYSTLITLVEPETSKKIFHTKYFYVQHIKVTHGGVLLQRIFICCNKCVKCVNKRGHNQKIGEIHRTLPVTIAIPDFSPCFGTLQHTHIRSRQTEPWYWFTVVLSVLWKHYSVGGEGNLKFLLTLTDNFSRCENVRRVYSASDLIFRRSMATTGT